MDPGAPSTYTFEVTEDTFTIMYDSEEDDLVGTYVLLENLLTVTVHKLAGEIPGMPEMWSVDTLARQ